MNTVLLESDTTVFMDSGLRRNDGGGRSSAVTLWDRAFALAAKLELALDERSGEFFGDSEDMKAIKSDARRLAAPAG